MEIELTKQQVKQVVDEYLHELTPSQLDRLFAEHINQFFKQDHKYFKLTKAAFKYPSTGE